MIAASMKDASAMTAHSAPQSRVLSIDIVRALTMVLMIFVNDLGGLKDIPSWLGHVASGVDGIGLADVVFPAFLFIVGLSLPFAIDARREKGEGTLSLLKHVLIRSVSLLLMGVFLVNGENINEQAMGMSRSAWYTICCLCFILLFNSYRFSFNRTAANLLRGLALLTLIVLAYLYRGGKEGEPVQYFQSYWWGILGLIGWAYLAAGCITVMAKGNISALIVSWLFFALLSMLHHAHLMPSFLSFIPEAIRGGTLTGLSLGGVVTAMLFRHYRQKGDDRSMTLLFIGLSVVLILLSVITRPYWKLAKLGATPAWLFLCSAFTLLAFLLVYWIADVYKKQQWFSLIRPAGTDTLLTYLIPYFAYAVRKFSGLQLPEILLTGGIGLFKTFLFALICVAAAGRLSKWGVRLKL
jgi:predicted acyltransferase